MCAYFSKAENEIPEAMKQALKGALNSMKVIAKAYSTKRECSV